MKVKIKKLNESAVIPKYSKAGDAGMDLVATSKETDKYGNNPEPYMSAENGRCCSSCNLKFVLPARLNYEEEI